jgi:23S rRNA (cytosine1962-C5)-methyltransferase/23S rRNA (guanine2445-N2)-methyltransferase / 23S rRNA (guanine2069-N7)-methyltransferase
MEDNSIILNRLKKNVKARKSLVKGSLNTAYRLYEKDIPEYPYIIDVYNQYAVIYEKGKKLDTKDSEQKAKHKEHLDLITSAVMEVLKINDSQIIVKHWKKYNPLEQKKHTASKENFFEVTEHDFKFKVNLHDYLNTGLFLDHRPLRQIIYKESQGKRVLNLFSYTGTASVAAAKGGGQVTTVDMSNTYLSWAEDNFERNGIPSRKHEFIHADVLKFIEEEDCGKFDIIILNPPSYVNSKNMKNSFKVQDEHYFMIKLLIKKLQNDGVIYFSTNDRDFKIDQRALESYKVKDITKKSIPLDFRDMKIHHCFEIRKTSN